MIIKNKDGTNSWEVQIFRVGIWNGEKYVLEDLQEIINNFLRFKEDIKVPLKLGHDMEQSLTGQEDGEPAIGWVSELKLEGNNLIATFDNVPDIVVGLIEAKAYKNVSSEILFGAKDKNERVGKILVGVALLGADIPAVSGLDELGAMFLILEQKGVLKNASLHSYQLQAETKEVITNGEEPMTEEEKKELEDLRKANYTLSGKLEDEQKEKEKLQDSVRTQKFNNNKLEFMNKINELVKEFKIVPAVRDKLEKQIDGQAETYNNSLSFDEETVLEMLSLNEKVNSKETATQEAGEEEEETGNTPDVLVRDKAKEYMAEGKVKTVHEGMQMVFAKDKKLAKEYSLYIENPQKYQEAKGA